MTDVPISVYVKLPAECSTGELSAFCALVNRGEEVAGLTSDRVLERGAKLLFVSVNGMLAAVGALKRQPDRYRRACFRKACIADRWSHHPFEIGWIYCDPTCRGGMSYRIIDALLREPEAMQPWYATVRTDNQAMLHSLRMRGFETAGVPYLSVEHPNAKIELLTRPATAAR